MTRLPRSLAAALIAGLLWSSMRTAGAADAEARPDGAAAASNAYAVVALVGDRISVIRYRPTVGSSLDQNRVQEVVVQDDHYDRLATRVAVDAVHAAFPDAQVQGVRLADPAPFGAPGALSGSDDRLPALLAAVRSQLGDRAPRYLLVLSKHRDDAHLKTDSGTLGSGKLSGLGFYIDAETRMKRTATGERGRGFVAPYAYVTASLVDLRDGAVVRFENVEETTTRANVGEGTDLDPWNALTADQKVRLLDAMLTRAVRAAVAHVVAPG